MIDRRTFVKLGAMTVCGSALGLSMVGCASSEEDASPPPDTVPDEATRDSQDKSAIQEPTAQGSSAPVLVAYFSASGNTQGIAQSILSGIGATEYRIEPETPYTDADLNYGDSSTRATLEQNDPTSRPAIGNPIESLDAYGTIFLGFPIWWGDPARILCTFLENNDLSGKTIIPFCTSSSTGIEGAQRMLEPLAAGATWKPGRRFSANTDAATVATWAQEYRIDAT